MGPLLLKPSRQHVTLVHGHILWLRFVIAMTNKTRPM